MLSSLFNLLPPKISELPMRHLFSLILAILALETEVNWDMNKQVPSGALLLPTSGLGLEILELEVVFCLFMECGFRKMDKQERLA